MKRMRRKRLMILMTLVHLMRRSSQCLSASQELALLQLGFHLHIYPFLMMIYLRHCPKHTLMLTKKCVWQIHALKVMTGFLMGLLMALSGTLFLVECKIGTI